MSFPLLFAALVGCLIGAIYVFAEPDDRSRFRISNACVVLTVIICLITRVVDDLATAFIVVGALTLVRLKAAIEDTREFGFLLLSVAAGLGIGERRYAIVSVGASLVCALAVYFSFGQEKDQKYLITVMLPKADLDGFRALVSSNLKYHRLRICEEVDGKLDVRLNFSSRTECANELIEWLRSRPDMSSLRYEIDTGRQRSWENT